MPGIAASTSETWLLGAPPNSVEAPENSFDCEVTWAWTSMPMTTSQSPVAPLISLSGLFCIFMARVSIAAAAARLDLRQQNLKHAWGGNHESSRNHCGRAIAVGHGN